VGCAQYEDKRAAEQVLAHYFDALKHRRYAKVNTQCQVDCQDTSYTQCEQQMIQTCQTQCKDKGGAIFCDGQFVNASNAQSCADELESKIEIHVDIEAAAKDVGDTVSDAAGSVCKSVDNGCSVAGACLGAGSALGALSPLAALALLRLRRRRASRR
jgi:predicted outer membrane repeat protein